MEEKLGPGGVGGVGSPCREAPRAEGPEQRACLRLRAASHERAQETTRAEPQHPHTARGEVHGLLGGFSAVPVLMARCKERGGGVSGCL